MNNQTKAQLNRAKIKNQRLKLESKLLKAKLAFLQKIEKEIAKDDKQGNKNYA